MNLLLLSPKEIFIELYDNPFLSEDDKEYIIRLVEREIFAMGYFLKLLEKNPNADQNEVCNQEVIENETNMVKLTTKCYDEVCIQDAKILTDNSVRAIMSKYEKPPETFYTVDNAETTPQVYCFDTLELIGIICNDNPINPKSNKPFSKYAIKLINDRFRKEINLYKRYLQS